METIMHESGLYRTTIDYDNYYEEPYNDGGNPIIEFSRRGASLTSYGSESAEFDGIKDGGAGTLDYLIGRHGTAEAVEIFTRYIRMFHGGEVKVIETNGYYDPGYLAYTTLSMAMQYWGFSSPEAAKVHIEPTTDEWEAWMNGEVYHIALERRVEVHQTLTFNGEEVGRSDHTEWQIVESCGGFYGYPVAYEEAESWIISIDNLID